MKIKLRNIKKWQKVDPDQLQRAWEQRYAPSKHITPTEEEFITSAAQMKPVKIYHGEKAPKDIQTVANVFGKKTTQVKFQEHIPVTEKVQRIAQDIEFRVTAKKLNKAQQAVHNIVSKNPKIFTKKPPKIGKTLPKSDWAHKNKELTKAILIARKETKPKSILIKGNLGIPQKGKKFSEESARSYFKLTPMSAYKGIGKPRTGQELKIKYEKVASRAIMHGSGAGEKFIKQVRDKGTPVKNVRDVEKKFLKIKKRGPVPEEQAFEMGFPAKSPGGQYEPFPGLESYKPFKDPSRRLTLGEEATIRKRKLALVRIPGKQGKPGTVQRLFAREFGKDRETGYTQKPQEGYWSKGKFIKYKGEWVTDRWGKRTFFRKEFKAPKVKLKSKTYSKKTQTLYPSLSKDQKWFKRVEQEWGKKKGRTPFDF